MDEKKYIWCKWWFLYIYLSIFANTIIDFKFACIQKHSIKNYFNHENLLLVFVKQIQPRWWLSARMIPDIGLIVREFANGSGGRGSIPGRVIPKTQKLVLDATLLNTQHYKARIKVKWCNPGKGVTPSPTPWCSSYRKGSLRVTLD